MDILKYLQKKGIDTIDRKFYNQVALWWRWYVGKVPSFHSYKIYQGRESIRCRRRSLKMAKTICEDMANFLLNESVTVTLEGSDAGYDFTKDVLTEASFFTENGNRFQELKCVFGTVAYLPYLTELEIDKDGTPIPGTGKVKLNYVTATDIYPISWSNGRIVECAFTFRETYKTKKYVLVQLHTIGPDGEYDIDNCVAEATQDAVGRDLSPAEWQDIPVFHGVVPHIDTGSDKPQFVIDRLNMVNNTDADGNSVMNPMGIALFANAVDVLSEIDTIFDSYDNEFTLGRKRIYVSPKALKSRNGNPVFDPHDTVYYQLPEDAIEEDKGFFRESNMELRVDQHSAAIQDQLNYLSYKCGFGVEHYRFARNQIQTATEVISQNSDLYRTIKKHELILEDVIKDLYRIILRLGVQMGVPGLDPDCEIRVKFDDSIIEDKDTERKRDMSEIAAGIMSREEFRAKWYGETEAQAKTRVPEAATPVME